MEPRKLGTQGLLVSAIGLGSMRMSEFYGTADEQESIATLHRALELGKFLSIFLPALKCGVNETPVEGGDRTICVNPQNSLCSRQS